MHEENRITFVVRNLIAPKFGRWIWQRQWRGWIHVTCWAKKKKKLAEHDYAKKISSPLLSHKRMNRYLLDIGLCKNKKNCGRRLFIFSCLRSAKFRYTRMEQSSQMGEIDERVRLFPLAIVFLTPFVELKYGKRMIPMKLHELTTREDVITRFKSHARGRRIWTFWCTSGTKSYSRSMKFTYTHIKKSSKLW